MSKDISNHVAMGASDEETASRNLVLVAILFELYQIPFDDDQAYMPYIKMDPATGKILETYKEWRFQPGNAAGDVTLNVMRAFDDPKWLEENPESALAQAKRLFETYFRLRDNAKSATPLAVIQKGKRFALIPWNASRETKHKLLRKLDELEAEDPS